MRSETLQEREHCNTLQHTATHCNTLQHTATRCNALQHTAPHCNALQTTAKHCKTLSHTQPTATRCNTLQHTATQCNTLQEEAREKRDSTTKRMRVAARKKRTEERLHHDEVRNVTNSIMNISRGEECHELYHIYFTNFVAQNASRCA